MTLADLIRLEQQMSDGPWEAVRLTECLIQPHVRQVMDGGKRYTICTPVHSNDVTMRNMVGIAASRNVLRELCEVATATQYAVNAWTAKVTPTLVTDKLRLIDDAMMTAQSALARLTKRLEEMG